MMLSPSLVGARLAPVASSWDSRDTILYALGIGAGQADPLDELQFTTDNSRGIVQMVYPTFGVIPGARVGVGGLLDLLGDSVDLSMMLHAEQSYDQVAPLPVEATVLTSATVTAAWDKGSATIVKTRSKIADGASGAIYGYSTQSMFFRGVGGWGGERGPSSGRGWVPDGPPFKTLTATTRPDQALLFRLSGDHNPLHSDPVSAAAAGFDRPILHGLCVYGVVARNLLAVFAGSDPARFVSVSGRFSKPVTPGDTLSIETWPEGGDDVSVIRFAVRTSPDAIVLSNGIFVYRT